MATTPLLLVTNAGLNTANGATPQGPYVHIVEFRIGSGVGYEPTRSDTGLNGNTLYKGVPLAYRNIGDNTLDIVCQIPADAGPFEFGEVGLYNSADNGVTETLFAKAVFDTYQTKYSSLGTNVATSFTFHCLLKLEQSIAIFKIDTLTPMAIVEVDKWSDVLLPAVSANPDVPLTLVRELDTAGCSSLLHYSVPEQERWTVGTNYTWFRNTTVSNATSNTVSVPFANFVASEMSTQDTKYVIEIAGRNDPFRVCSSLVQTGSTATFTIHPDNFQDLPTVGTGVRVYENVNYKSITLPLATGSTQGIVRAGNGIAVPAAGVFEVYGLLHGVPGSGRILTNADNLNNQSIASGEYSFTAGSHPNNLPPVTLGGRVRISNFQGYIVQQVFPEPSGVGNEDPNDPNNQVWWRMGWQNIVWTQWRSMTPPQSGLSGGSIQFLGDFAPNVTASGTFEEAGAIMAWNSGGDPSIMGYLNGNQVTAGDSDGGGEGITIVGYKGSSWACRTGRRTMHVFKLLLTS